MAKQATSFPRDGTSALLAKKFQVSLKAIRDVWNLRTYTSVTMPYWTRDDRASFIRKQGLGALVNLPSNPSAPPTSQVSAAPFSVQDTHIAAAAKRHCASRPMDNKSSFGHASRKQASNHQQSLAQHFGAVYPGLPDVATSHSFPAASGHRQEQTSKSLVDCRRIDRLPLLFSSDSEGKEKSDSLGRADRMAEEWDRYQRPTEINPAASSGIVTGHARAHIGGMSRPPNVSLASTPHSANGHGSTSPRPVQRHGASTETSACTNGSGIVSFVASGYPPDNPRHCTAQDFSRGDRAGKAPQSILQTQMLPEQHTVFCASSLLSPLSQLRCQARAGPTTLPPPPRLLQDTETQVRSDLEYLIPPSSSREPALPLTGTGQVVAGWMTCTRCSYCTSGSVCCVCGWSLVSRSGRH